MQGIKLVNCTNGCFRGNGGLSMEIENSGDIEVSHNTIGSGKTLLRGKNIKNLEIHENRQFPRRSNVLKQAIQWAIYEKR